MRTITASRYVLEPQVAEHALEMFAVLGDPAIYEFENAPPASETWLRDRYKRLESRRPKEGTEVWLNWIVRLPTSQLAGYVQATILPKGIALIAYELNSRYWRQGIGSSAVQLVIEELQNQYGISELVAVLKSANYRSKALLHKLDFVYATNEQTLRYRDEADEIVMVKALGGSAHAA